MIAREVVVYGNVKGNLRAKDRIEIKKDGSVNGDLTTARIMIEDGAYFKGSIEIDKSSRKGIRSRLLRAHGFRARDRRCRTEDHLSLLLAKFLLATRRAGSSGAPFLLSCFTNRVIS